MPGPSRKNKQKPQRNGPRTSYTPAAYVGDIDNARDWNHIVLILCDFLELPDLTTRSGLKKVHAKFDAIVGRLDQVYAEHEDNVRIAGGVVGIYAKMCADSILRNKLFQRGFVSKLLPLLDKPYSLHMALRSLSSVAHHGSDIVHTELAKLTPNLLRLLDEFPEDPKVAELSITIMSHSIVGVVAKHVTLATHTPYKPPYLKIRPLLDAICKQLKNPTATRYLIDHAVTLLSHLAYHYGAEIKAHKSTVHFFLAGLRNKNWEFRCQCLSGIIRMHLHEDEDDMHLFDPNIYLQLAKKRWPDNLADVFSDYGQARTDMYIRMTTQRDFQNALMKVASSRDLYAFGLSLYELIMRTEWAIADGFFQEQDPRTGQLKMIDSSALGLPFQRYPDALPHCAKAIRAKGKPEELDKADVLDIKYLIMKQRTREAADMARNSLQRNPDFAYYHYAISLTADHVEGLKASKKGLKCKQTTLFIRYQLIQRAVEHAGDYGLATLNEAGHDSTKWEEGVAFLMSALDDSKLFVREAPPDNHRMRNVLYWNILLGVLVRGPDASPDLREIKSSLSKLKFTDDFTEFMGLRPPNTQLRLAQETLVKNFESGVTEWGDIIANMEGPEEKEVDPEKAEDDLAAWLDDMKLDNGEREPLMAHPKVNVNHVALYQPRGRKGFVPTLTYTLMFGQDSSENDLVLFCEGNGCRKLIVQRPLVYPVALQYAQSHFGIPTSFAIFHTDQLDLCRGERAEVSPDAWPVVIRLASRFYVYDRREDTCSETNVGEQVLPVAGTVGFNEISTKLKFQFYERQGEWSSTDMECSVSSTMPFKDVFQAYEAHMRRVEPRKPAFSNGAEIGYHYKNQKILPSQSPQDLNMGDDAVIECYPIFKGFGLGSGGGAVSFRKPVIYLFSPIQVNAKIKVSLVPQWSFAATYPVVPVKPSSSADLHQQIRWSVQTQADGSLKTETGLEVAYLFWEANTNPTDSISPLPEANRFIPNQASVNPYDSVALSVDALPEYLEKVLLALGLHTEARSSFITYWLPSFLKHKHVALRFVNQSSYESAAPLEVTPQPDVITRVFMLFKGISVDTGVWDAALKRASLDHAVWRDVVGVDVQKAWDHSLFRVLEWGGMELS
ncbi:hypothetical protein VNI00_006230 [Paramarasmius palmivorus]|uniref:Uncharacterized protein n=1 Tax=Paramarasmius palmivorus TaxID=297713 RepID=A0AAW0D966_9AGAR